MFFEAKKKKKGKLFVQGTKDVLIVDSGFERWIVNTGPKWFHNFQYKIERLIVTLRPQRYVILNSELLYLSKLSDLSMEADVLLYNQSYYTQLHLIKIVIKISSAFIC